jgi:cytochrome bd-type quinol oxidase subunit 2
LVSGLGITFGLILGGLLTTTSGSSNYFTGFLGPFVLLGGGLSLAFVTLNITVLGGLQRSEMGAASGLLQASQQIGLSLGVAILTTIYQTTLANSQRHPAVGVSPSVLAHDALAHSLASAVIAAAAFSAGALLITLIVIRTPRRASDQSAGSASSPT